MIQVDKVCLRDMKLEINTKGKDSFLSHWITKSLWQSIIQNEREVVSFLVSNAVSTSIKPEKSPDCDQVESRGVPYNNQETKSPDCT